MWTTRHWGPSPRPLRWPACPTTTGEAAALACLVGVEHGRLDEAISPMLRKVRQYEGERVVPPGPSTPAPPFYPF